MIAGLSGVVVGGLISELRSIVALRRENRRTANRVLYHLLDIWHSLLRSDTGELTRTVARTMVQQLGVPDNEGALSAALSQSPQLQELMTKAATDVLNATLDERYQFAVDALAPVDPVLAFRLSGKAALVRHRDWTADWIEAATQTQAPAEIEREAHIRLAVQEAVSGQIHEEAVSALEEDIDEVAKRLGWLTSRAVQRTLARNREAIDTRVAEVIGEYIRRIQPVLQATMRPAPPIAS